MDQELTLPSGLTVTVRKVTSQDVKDALSILGEDECSNIRAGRKNGAALLEILDLVAIAGLVQPLDEDEQSGEMPSVKDLPFEDKNAIFDAAYEGTE